MNILDTAKENSTINRNPITTIFGIIILIIDIIMLLIKYVVPLFYTLKEPVSYHWGVLIAIGCVGVLFIFLTDSYFARLFNRGDKYIGKVTGTDKEN